MIPPRLRILFALAVAIASSAAPTAAPDRATPPAVQKLLDCRAISDRDARLACFDTQAAAIGSAIDKADLVVADRQQLTKVRRSLFGLTLPSLDVFASHEKGDNKPVEGVTEIQATIARVSKDALGRWVLVLDDGVRWTQVDTQELARDPRAGMPIRIRRAAMGSFLANVDKQIAIRVHRDN